jgi:hypothetical protein
MIVSAAKAPYMNRSATTNGGLVSAGRRRLVVVGLDPMGKHPSSAWVT